MNTLHICNAACPLHKWIDQSHSFGGAVIQLYFQEHTERDNTFGQCCTIQYCTIQYNMSGNNRLLAQIGCPCPLYTSKSVRVYTLSILKCMRPELGPSRVITLDSITLDRFYCNGSSSSVPYNWDSTAHSATIPGPECYYWRVLTTRYSSLNRCPRPSWI